MPANMKNYWYSPKAVLDAVFLLSKLYTKDVLDRETLFQRVAEMKCAAMLAIAMHSTFKHKIYMQASEDDFPDVYTLYQEEMPSGEIETWNQIVEVVEYKDRESRPLGEFILQSKLTNPKKSYSEDTIILCFSRKKRLVVDFKEVLVTLKKEKFKPSFIYFVGQTPLNTYEITCIWPEIKRFVADKSMYQNYPKPDVMLYQRGITRAIDRHTKKGEFKLDPYGVLYLNRKKIDAKYGSRDI